MINQKFKSIVAHTTFKLTPLALLMASCATMPIKATKLPDTLKIAKVSVDDDISREKLDLISKVLKLRLESKGYRVVSDLASNHYQENKYPEVNLTLDRGGANFGLGYWDTVSGEVKVEEQRSLQRGDPQLIYSHEDSVSRRGGLIFNTGQVVTGLLSQINRFKDDAFSVLSSELTSKLLSGVKRLEKQPQKVTTLNYQVNFGQDGNIRLCAATPLPAFLQINPETNFSLNQTLEAVSSTTLKQRCGLFDLSWLRKNLNSSHIIAIDTTGIVAQSPLTIPSQIACVSDIEAAIANVDITTLSDLAKVCGKEMVVNSDKGKHTLQKFVSAKISPELFFQIMTPDYSSKIYQM